MKNQSLIKMAIKWLWADRFVNCDKNALSVLIFEVSKYGRQVFEVLC